MEDWTINYYRNENQNFIAEWISTLETSTQAKILKNITLLEKRGISLKSPYTKQLEGKLWELRTKDQKGIYRIIYFTRSEQQITLLHGFVKKTNKTPSKEIEIAKIRMKEVIENE